MITEDEKQIAAILAREDLYFFSRYTFYRRKGFKWQQAKHHKIIGDALMRVYRGECKRLIINLPPRYSKTQLMMDFAAWSMGHAPDSEFIHASYSGTLAVSNSASMRDVIQSEAYREIFPGVELESDAKSHWKTTAGGVMYATGSSGTITGFGAGKHRDGFGGALLLDDLHKADEARSDTMREGVIEWFQNTLESRKNSPDTPIILIMQRLHERDIAGWLISGGNGEEWEHVCIPAIQPDGTALWPEKHSIEDLHRMREANSYVFAGQYMQQPSPDGGGLFKAANIGVVDAIPAGVVSWARGWDFASTTTGDYTAGLRLGRMADGRFIIADVVRVRVGPDERDAAILATAQRDGGVVKQSLPQDPGQAGKTQVLYLTKMLQGFRVVSSPESGDKVTRAEPFAAQCNVGNVVMVRAPWNDALIAELNGFPNGANDDQVDAGSRAFGELITNRPYTISKSVKDRIARK
ncbi:MAG: phage terminase large subunit [Thiobacillus sp.]